MRKQFTRILSAVCAAAMLSGGLAMIPASAAEVKSAKVMGDMTGDLRVTIEGAKAALDLSIAGEIGLADTEVNEESNAGDIDMNGIIETTDALAIMRYFCQTLVGDQPLWSEVRKLTYHDGTEFDPCYEPDHGAEGKEKHLPFEKRGMYLEIGCAEGEAGEIVEIPVYLAGIEGFAGFQYFQNTPEEVILTDIRSSLGLDKYDANGNRIKGDDDAGYSDENGNTWTGCANLANGAFVWAAADNKPVDAQKGEIIATYYYQIPETAQKGDLYVISADTESTMFVTWNDDFGCLSYQYTLLDGVIAVK